MRKKAMQRFLALALSALMLLGSCSLAETVPDEQPEAVQTVQEPVEDTPKATEQANDAAPQAGDAGDTELPGAEPAPTEDLNAAADAMDSGDAADAAGSGDAMDAADAGKLDGAVDVDAALLAQTPLPTPAPTPPSTSEANFEPTPEPTMTPGGVTGIVIPEKITLKMGETLQLEPQLQPEGIQSALTYGTSHPDVAYIDETGVVHGLSAGETPYSVRAENGYTVIGDIVVEYVQIPPEQIVIPEDFKRCIEMGETVQLWPSVLPEGAHADFTYRAEDPRIIEVGEDDGRVYGVRCGETQLIVTTDTGLSVSVPMTVVAEGADSFDIQNGVLRRYRGGARYVTVPDGVTAIADRAFTCCDQIEELILPDGVRSIGAYAFERCSALSSMRLPDSVETIGESAFVECYQLKDVALSSSLVEIGDRAFYSIAISSIQLPASLKRLGAEAFYGCGLLTELKLPEGLTSIGEHALRYTKIRQITLPGSLGAIDTYFLPDDIEVVVVSEGITAIDISMFHPDVHKQLKRIELPASLERIDYWFADGIRGLTVYGPAEGYVRDFFADRHVNYVAYGDVDVSDEFRIEGTCLTEYTGKGGAVVIPEGVTIIGEEAFYNRSDVTSVQFHAGVKEIGQSAFNGCTGLTELNLPDQLEEMGPYAFRGCTGLTQLTLPGSMGSTGINSFDSCTSLESVTVGEGMTNVSSSFKGCTSLKRVQLPSTLDTISESAFYGCTSLAELKIPANVTYIGSWCFRNCTSLAELELPAGLRYLKDGAFEGCTKLRKVNLPSGLNRLYYDTFKNCASLASVTVPDGVWEINSNCFEGCASLKEVYVPASVKEIGGLDDDGGDVFAGCPQLTVRGLTGTEIHKYCAAYGVPFAAADAGAESIRFPEGNLTLGVGQIYTPELRVDYGAALGGVKFTSSSSRVQVNKTTGELKARRTGTATITAKSASGAKASFKVTVKAAPKRISFKQKNVTVAVGETFTLDYTLPANTAAGVKYEILDFFVQDMTYGDGKFVACDPGVDEVKITTHNGKSDTCTITVLPRPTAVYADREHITLRQTLTDRILPHVNEGSVCNAYLFASSDPGIVEVDADGGLRGISQGTAEITVIARCNQQARTTCTVTVIAPPPKIELEAEAVTLGVKESYSLNPRYVTEESDYSAQIHFKSSNTRYVTVGEDGTITARRAGTATVTATSDDGVSATCKVTVKRAPSSVKFSTAKLEMAAGDARKLTWKLSSRSAGGVSFESSDPAVLDVASDGTVTAKAPGAAKVKVRTYNGKTATCTVTVHPQPERVAFAKNGDPMRFAVGMKGTLKAALYPSNYGSCSFASSDPNVISIDASTGAYAVHTIGECDLTVTAYNGVSETRHARTYAAATYAKCVDARLNLGVGETYRMRIEYSHEYGQECEPGFSYKSSKTSVATVDENGVITARRAGSATITATSFNGRLKTSCRITVKKAPKSLKLSATELTLGQNETYQLTATLSPRGCGGLVHFESSDNNLAFVDEKGNIMATRHEGTVVITASTYNGLTQSCTVTLDRQPASVAFPVDRLDLNVGMKVPMDVQVKGGSCLSLYVDSSNPKVAYMDGSGRIVAKKKGSAEITVETYNGLRASLYVTVANAPKKYTIALPNELTVGYMYNLMDYYRTTPETNPYLTFGSAKVSNSRAVIVENELGVFLVPVKAGTFDLTVKSYNGKSVRKRLKAVETDLPIEPEIVSPVRVDAKIQDYYGDWAIKGVCSEGMTIPPEMLGLQGTAIHVAPVESAFRLGGVEFSVDARAVEGTLLLTDPEGSELACQLHENGMVSMRMAEDVVMWFERR